MANLSLADHLDMARPAHEDPGFPVSSSTLLAASGFRNKIRSFSGNSNKSSLLINQYHIITTITANMVQVAAA